MDVLPLNPGPPGGSLWVSDPLGFATPAILEVCAEAGVIPTIARPVESPGDLASESGPFATATPPLRTPEEAGEWARAGADWFVIQPDQLIVTEADELDAETLAHAEQTAIADGVFSDETWKHGAEGDPGAILRAGIRFGWAIAQAERCAREIAAHLPSGKGGVWFEFRVGNDRPTSPAEHAFIAREFSRRGVSLAALAPALPGPLEPGAEAEIEPGELSASLSAHSAIASSHLLSAPHLLDQRRWLLALPTLDRPLHIADEATCWLESLRILAESDPAAFREALALAHERFPLDRGGQGISTTEDEVRHLPGIDDARLPAFFLGQRAGRQLLFATRRAVLAQPGLRSALARAVSARAADYRDRIRAVLRLRPAITARQSRDT